MIDYPFDDTTKNQSPEEFARDVLQGKLGSKALVVGDNFRFGKGAKGDADTLKVLGEEYGFDVYVIPMVEYAGDVVSSSRIREDIKAGNLIDANKMLNGEDN